MKMLTPKNLAKTIKAYRKANGLNQGDFAKQVGISKRMLQYIEKGENTTIDTAARILESMKYEVFYTKIE